ncbi:MAG: hypothetical protein J1E02_09660 [Coprobacter sp.]|nr:hypothetical protein [Coprobacter sp.]
MKIITFLAAGFLTFSSLASAAAYKSIIVNKKDGSKVCINIKDNLKITCDKETLYATGGTYDFQFPFAEISGWFHNPDLQEEVDPNPPVGISSAEAEAVGVAQMGDHILLTRLPENTVVTFCSVEGKMIYNNTTASDTHIVPLTQLRPGLYILTVNRQTTKILVK